MFGSVLYLFIWCCFFVRHVDCFVFGCLPAVRSYSSTHTPCLPSCLLVLAPSEAKPSTLRGGIVVLILPYLFHRAYFAMAGFLVVGLILSVHPNASFGQTHRFAPTNPHILRSCSMFFVILTYLNFYIIISITRPIHELFKIGEGKGNGCRIGIRMKIDNLGIL